LQAPSSGWPCKDTPKKSSRSIVPRGVFNGILAFAAFSTALSAMPVVDSAAAASSVAALGFRVFGVAVVVSSLSSIIIVLSVKGEEFVATPNK